MSIAAAGLVLWLASAPPQAGAAPDAAAAEPSLENSAWTVTELVGTPVTPQPEPRTAHLVFGAGGRLSGSDGCNRVTGTYTLSGRGVTFGPLASTRMACPGSEEDVTRLRAVLRGTSHWSYVDGTLQLYGATGKPLAVLERREMPLTAAGAPALRGTTWRLVGFTGGDDSTRTPDDRDKYTIAFRADGRVAVRLDCNRGTGTWKANPSAGLELGPLALTRAMCPEGSLHDFIVAQWSYVRSFVLRDGHLFLSLMADGGIFELEPAASKK